MFLFINNGEIERLREEMRRCRCYEGQRLLKVEEVKYPHTLFGVSYILRLYRLYINSVKEVVRHLEVQLGCINHHVDTETGFGLR